MNSNRAGHYKDIKVGELLELLARDYPDREALVCLERGQRYSFIALERAARATARGLMSIGVERGERVALWATNLPEWIILQFALAKIGAALVSVNTGLRASELEFVLKQSEAATIICAQGFKENNYVETLYQLAPELRSCAPGALRCERLPSLRRAILIGDNRQNEPAGFLPFSALADRAGDVSEAALDARHSESSRDDIVCLQYTSGTTGAPKGVMLTHENIVNNAYWIGEGMQYTLADKVCLPLPMFHCGGSVIGALAAYTHAVSVVLVEYFQARKVLEQIAAERCTAICAVPTMFIAMLDLKDFADFDLSSLRTGVIGGALCPEMLMRRLMREMHLPEITIAYGLTEASPIIAQTGCHDSMENRARTVGRALPEIEIAIIDPFTLALLPINSSGELCARGYNVMKGYYKDREATRNAIISINNQAGWLRTGDQAAIDEAGYVHITGRIKDIIIRGGENISCKEVEELLRSHPSVADVVVYGIASSRYGEEVAAAVRLKADEYCIAEVLSDFCRDRIAHFKIPRYIRFVDEFPVTASGKVQRYKLRAMHEELLAVTPV